MKISSIFEKNKINTTFSCQTHQIFKKISDISNKNQINNAFSTLPTVKDRAKLLSFIIKRKQETEDRSQIARFHKVHDLLQKIKGKIMSIITVIRERNMKRMRLSEGLQERDMQRLSIFSNYQSPKAKEFIRNEDFGVFSKKKSNNYPASK